MKAVILAGGEGTRLRPLTLAEPKPVVPIADRPFLRHQLALLRGAGITEVIFSLGYRPDRIEAAFGDGSRDGVHIVYVTEASPLGTGGAVRNALAHLDSRTVVLNGDVLCDLDLGAVLKRHETSGAAATIVLTPVENPSAYGLVETDSSGRVLRFIEKPSAAEVTTDTINAGVYVLETRLLDLMPPGVNYSIERGFFPTLLSRGESFFAHVHRGYWIDIGTREKYLQVHDDILSGRFPVTLDGDAARGGRIHPTATVAADANCDGPFYVGPGCRVEATATIGAGTVLVRDVTVRSGAKVARSVVWAGALIAEQADVEGSLLGAHVQIGAHSVVHGASLGDASILTPHSRFC